VPPDDAMVDAWIEAGKVLGIEVIAPFHIQSGDGPIRYTAFLRDFGCPAGMVVVPIDSPDRDRLTVAAREAGYYISCLGPSYEQFGRDRFEEALGDWGWFGDEASTPTWYKPWWS
jgi:hypothetical protein